MGWLVLWQGWTQCLVAFDSLHLPPSRPQCVLSHFLVFLSEHFLNNEKPLEVIEATRSAIHCLYTWVGWLWHSFLDFFFIDACFDCLFDPTIGDTNVILTDGFWTVFFVLSVTFSVIVVSELNFYNASDWF